VSRVESPEDRRVRIVSRTLKGKELIAPVFRKHAAEIRRVSANASPNELRNLETTLKRLARGLKALGPPRNEGLEPSLGIKDRVGEILAHPNELCVPLCSLDDWYSSP